MYTPCCLPHCYVAVMCKCNTVTGTGVSNSKKKRIAGGLGTRADLKVLPHLALNCDLFFFSSSDIPQPGFKASGQVESSAMQNKGWGQGRSPLFFFISSQIWVSMAIFKCCPLDARNKLAIVSRLIFAVGYQTSLILNGSCATRKYCNLMII